MAFLTACAVGPDFHRPAPPRDADYGKAGKVGETVSAKTAGGDAQRFVADMDIPGQWWSVFNSPALDRLVEQALAGNPNIDAAKAALRQAQELHSAQRAAYFPTIQGNFGATRAKDPVNSLANPTVAPNPTYTLYTAQLTLSYLPDVFGGTRRAVEAAKAQAENARFQLAAAYVTLSSNVVVTALQEASLRGQIAAAERLLVSQHKLTEAIRKQRAIGMISDVDLLAQEAAEAQTAQTLPPLNKQLGQTRDALTALLGHLPSEEPEETFELKDLKLPHDLPVGIPSKLVEQRPDVRQAEENLHMASAEVGVALANMLPQFTISAAAGSSALKFGDLFTAHNGFWDVGASLVQTLIDGGALLHRKRAAEAALDQAGAQYRAAVILACQNVADALRALEADAEALRAAAEANRAADAALTLARRRYEIGMISFATVLVAEQTYQQAEIALVQAQAARYSDTAGLFQALGGGWWNRMEEALK